MILHYLRVGLLRWRVRDLTGRLGLSDRHLNQLRYEIDREEAINQHIDDQLVAAERALEAERARFAAHDWTHPKGIR